MADIDVRRVHGLGIKAARAAADQMVGHLGTKFDLKGDWHGHTLTFGRPGVSGTLAITDHDVHLSVTLGFLLKALKGSIERAVHAEMDDLFAAAPKTKKAAKPGSEKKPPKKAR